MAYCVNRRESVHGIYHQGYQTRAVGDVTEYPADYANLCLYGVNGLALRFDLGHGGGHRHGNRGG